ncbi:MAG TPA: PaaI family thioesterase [Steroidobacteraceae bacterium]
MNRSIAFRDDIPFIKDMGIEFISADGGRSVVSLNLLARHLNSWSVAHGGVLMTLLDVAMAIAGRSLDSAVGGGITVEMKTSFLQPAKAGSRLIASAHAFHRSSTLVFCDGEVRDTGQRLIAKSLGTFKYRRVGAPENSDG